ncbi:secreted and transmembrane protein 1 isoform X1 [Aotus nancymaae]|uniref:secreted and transmembrane protein 1 isoform X1 n=1 Tax=Aotus nancymaae TaxID=37293 RepID=UPI0030FE70B6
MQTCPLPFPSPVSQAFGALLLLAASLSAQNEGWDAPTCTEGVVSVSQGKNVVMSCNISNTFSLVTITLRHLRENKTIFHVSQGRFSRDDWQLWVQGGVAQLLIKGVRDSHAGLYVWHLRGHQRNNRYITLEVSEPQGLKDSDRTQLLEPGTLRASKNSQGSIGWESGTRRWTRMVAIGAQHHGEGLSPWMSVGRPGQCQTFLESRQSRVFSELHSERETPPHGLLSNGHLPGHWHYCKACC